MSGVNHPTKRRIVVPHVQEVPAVTTKVAARVRPVSAEQSAEQSAERDPARALLPSPDPVRVLDESGVRVPGDLAYPEPPVETLRQLYGQMVVGRRLDAQCTALTKQGRLAVYPSSRGQEACQVGAVLALRPTDWM